MTAPEVEGTGSPAFIRAAGGLVWRNRERREIAVIYRDRHQRNECCLPKGKLDGDEDWEQAAEREVLEETCCRVGILGFGGLLHYYVGVRPKVVVYFEMVAFEELPFQPSREVREVRWVPAADVQRLLTHDGERDLVRRFLSAM